MVLSDNLFWRRLHSFTGAFPLGVFLLFHLYENSHSILGPEVYDGRVQGLRSLPYLGLIEAILIYMPLLYHAFYGIYVWYTGRNNYPRYAYPRNGLYALQRVTGIIAFVFVFFHIYDQRLLPSPSFDTVGASLGNPAVFAVYLVGIAAVGFHFFNGVWNFFVKWGVAIGERSQKALLAACTVLGLGLIFVGLRALAGFMR